MSSNFGNWTTISYILANFLLRMRRNGQNSTSGQIFNPKFEIVMGCFLFEYEFWWSFRQDLYVFCAKNCIRNAQFSEFGEYWGWGENFLTKPPKGTSLPDFTRFEPSLQACARKKDTTKSHREVILHVFAGNFHPTKFNQNWHTSRGVRLNQSHRV